MPTKRIRAVPIILNRGDDGEYTTSVSVASHRALVVISELAAPSDDMLTGVALITEDEEDE